MTLLQRQAHASVGQHRDSEIETCERFEACVSVEQVRADTSVAVHFVLERWLD